MKQIIQLFIATIVLAALSSSALAQGGSPAGMPNYDPKTEMSVKGTVDDVQQNAGKHGWMGTHLLLKTNAKTLEVHVGPSGYITQKQFSFAKGDALEVVGSRVMIEGKPAVIAREITKDGKTLVLRNASGI
ncbi:MAG: hypothetical protein WA628_11970, partial [Terriglobales bacterium]